MELMVSVDLARSWFGSTSGSIDGLHSRDDVSSISLTDAQLDAQPELGQAVNPGIEQSPSGEGELRETSLEGAFPLHTLCVNPVPLSVPGDIRELHQRGKLPETDTVKASYRLNLYASSGPQSADWAFLSKKVSIGHIHGAGTICCRHLGRSPV